MSLYMIECHRPTTLPRCTPVIGPRPPDKRHSIPSLEANAEALEPPLSEPRSRISVTRLLPLPLYNPDQPLEARPRLRPQRAKGLHGPRLEAVPVRQLAIILAVLRRSTADRSTQRVLGSGHD